MKQRQVHNILHVVPHLGGGVGSVILNYLEEVKGCTEFQHSVMCLEYANERAKLASKTVGFSLEEKMAADHERILVAIAQADVVLIHWWNHPLLYAFLVRETLPASRIIFWSHISGLNPPYVFNAPALSYPDLFVFTSPVSLKTSEVINLRQERQERLRVIWSTGGVEQMVTVEPKPHSGFNVGYIGTVDYGKLHPHFLEMCGRVKIPDPRFIVCGGPSEKQIQREALRYDNNERFTFTGIVTDIKPYLEQFDVFGYPLAPYHYGTCEQVLGECMAAGVAPVVMANPTESYIVENGVTGIVVPDEESYARAIEGLYHNVELRNNLSVNAREAAREIYSLDLMAQRWERVFCEALQFSRTPREWSGKRRGKSVKAAEVFVESLGNYAREFEEDLSAQNEREKKNAFDGIRRMYRSSGLWKATTRGTPSHYASFFPEDKTLRTWRDLAAGELDLSNDIDDMRL